MERGARFGRVPNFDRTRTYDVDPNVILPIVAGRASGIPDKSSFDCGIGDCLGTSNHAQNGRCDYDRTSLLLDHPWEHGASEVLRSQKRDLQTSAPFFIG